MAKLKDSDKFGDLDKKFRVGEKKHDVIKKISSHKTKLISAKVVPEKYDQFTKINKKIGISNNGVLNMLINQYIESHQKELEG